MNKGELIAIAEGLLDLRIDTAMPQDFFNEMGEKLAKLGADDPHPYSHFFGWAYPHGGSSLGAGRGLPHGMFGFPLPMTPEGWEVIADTPYGKPSQ